MSKLKFSISKKKCLHTNLSSNRTGNNWMSYPPYISRSPLDLSCMSNVIYNKDILTYLSHKNHILSVIYIYYLHEYKLLLHYIALVLWKQNLKTSIFCKKFWFIFSHSKHKHFGQNFAIVTVSEVQDSHTYGVTCFQKYPFHFSYPLQL
jgi:hypothetical protein